MKKAIATFCLIGSALALSACESSSMGYVDTDPPYAMDRTATHDHGAAMEATPVQVESTSGDHVFQRAQTK